MRNPVVVREAFRQLDGLSNTANGDSALVCGIALNHQTDKAFVLFKNGSLKFYDNSNDLLTCYSTILLEFEGLRETWIKIDYVAAIGAIVCVSQEGSIATVSDTNPDEAPEQIGMIDNGISSAAWSPDYSCLLLVTNNDTLLCMSANWDVLYEVPHPPLLAGSATTVSWKGDGDMVSVLSTDQDDQTTRIRLYNKQLELVSIARNVNEGGGNMGGGGAGGVKGIGKAMAFSPNGVLVAFDMKKPSGSHQIAFIEKNGLRHGEFDLPYPRGENEGWVVSSLQYDPSSTFLLVHWHHAVTAEGCVQIYHRHNYYWYLGQEFAEKHLQPLTFDPEHPEVLYLTHLLSPSDSSAAGTYVLRTVELGWAGYECVGARDYPLCVVHGSQLHISPLRHSIIPPPMYKHLLSLPLPLRHMSLVDVNGAGWLGALLLSDRGVIGICQGGMGGVERAPEVVVWNDLRGLDGEGGKALAKDLREGSLACHRFRNITISLTADTIIVYVIASCPSSPADGDFEQGDNCDGEVLICMELDRNAFFERKQLLLLRFGKLTHVPGVMYHMQMGETDGVMGMQSAESLNFELYSLPKSWEGTWNFTTNPPAMILSLPEICPTSHVVEVTGAGAAGEVEQRERIVVSLSSRNHLYLQDVLVHTHVTSLAFSPSTSLLYFTTPTPPLLHYLYLPSLSHLLAQEGGGGEGVYGLIHRYLSDPRPIERGGRLVSIVDTRVVMLLPRGNLEVFEPRSLVLLTLYSLVVAKRDLLGAFLLCRRQKLSFQVFIEVCPEIFLEEVHTFVSGLLQLKQGAEYLCQFIMNIGEGKGGGNGGYSVGLFLLVKDVYEELLLRNVAYMKQITQDGGFIARICQETRRYLFDHLFIFLTDGARKCGASALSLIQAILCTYAQEGGAEGVHQAVDFMLLIGGGDGKSQGGIKLRDYIREGINTQFFQLPAVSVPITSTLALAYQRLHTLLTAPPGPLPLPANLLPTLLKYLTHLLPSSTLYPLLLGRGEIGMCKLLLSALQLDPRTYLPPLRKYESMLEGGKDEGTSGNSFGNGVEGGDVGLLIHIYVLALMQVEGVGVGEEEMRGNGEEVLVHYLALLKQLFLEEEKGELLLLHPHFQLIVAFLRSSMESVVKGEIDKGKGEELVKFFELLENHVLRGARGKGRYARAILEEFRNCFFLHMGLHVRGKDKDNQESVGFFMSTSPPSVSLALDTLLKGGAYYQAYSLAVLHEDNLGVRGLALQIIELYRAHLRRCMQLSSDFQVSLPDPTPASSTSTSSQAPSFPIPLPSFPPLQTHASLIVPPPSLADFVAQLCVEWGGVGGSSVGDVEGGVEILLQSKKYTSALKLARRYGRGADLGQEVLTAARSVCEEVVEYIKGVRLAYLQRVGFLKTIWEVTDEKDGGRLQTLTALDPDLQYYINNNIDMPGVGIANQPGAPGGGEGDGGDWGETASEFSSLSLYSSSSRTSTVVSSSSYLSNISDARSLGGGSVSGSVKGTGGAFVIRGLDHALLSRGGVEDCNPRGGKAGSSVVGKIGLGGENGDGATQGNDGGVVDKRTRNRQKRDQTARRQKRIERSKAKGHVQDSFQLQKEEASCEELTRISLALPDLIALVLDLSQALLSTGVLSDRLAVREMGQEMQALIKAMQTNEPPRAPKYPLAYLQLRQMASVVPFQAHRFEEGAENTAKGESWFQLTARAIEHWFKSRLLLFSS